jgi:hypothetical protein
VGEGRQRPARSAAAALVRDLGELTHLLATAGRGLCVLICGLAALRVALSLLLTVALGVLIAAWRGRVRDVVGRPTGVGHLEDAATGLSRVSAA